MDISIAFDLHQFPHIVHRRTYMQLKLQSIPIIITGTELEEAVLCDRMDHLVASNVRANAGIICYRVKVISLGEPIVAPSEVMLHI